MNRLRVSSECEMLVELRPAIHLFIRLKDDASFVLLPHVICKETFQKISHYLPH